MAAVVAGLGMASCADSLADGSTLGPATTEDDPGRRGEAGAPTSVPSSNPTTPTESSSPQPSVPPVSEPTVPDRTLSFRPEDLAPVRFGVAVEGSSLLTLAELEEAAGARVGIVRVFARWDTPFPNATHQTMLNEGRMIHLSVRPRTDAGVVIPWSDIAAAEPGSEIYERLDEWTSAVAGYGSQVYFTLNHEPETRDSAANGEADEFIAAWRFMADRLRANGGDEVKLVLVLGRGAYANGAIDEWYPGDDVVDVVGADPYNWYLCQGTDRAWIEPAELIEPALEFARAHGKRLAIPEIASTEDPDDPARKADWIVALAEHLGSDDVAADLEYVAWFSVHDRSWPDCLWEYDSSPASAAAFADAVAWFETS